MSESILLLMAITEVLKYEGDNDVFVWKHPVEDFNTKSQLVVHESQEAVFFKDGVALDSYGPGRYQLSTENIPFLRRILNAPSKGVSPYHCELYFINKVDVMDVKWGTKSPILVNDPKYNVILPIGANGQFSLRVADSKRLLTTLVGTLQSFNRMNLINAFRGILMKNIKEYLSRKIAESAISFLEVNTHLLEMSDALKSLLAKDFLAYGLELLTFNISTIFVPPDDPSYLRIKDALAKKAEMDIVGYSYAQGRTFDIYEKAASNEGALTAPLMNAGIGLGLATKTGEKLMRSNSDLFDDDEDEVKKLVCPKCHAVLPQESIFCFKCGTRVSEPVCPKCGAKVSSEMAFCPKCGGKLNE